MRIFKGFAVFCLAVTALVCVVNAGTSCKNDKGADVAWFFMYKLPKGVKDTKGRVYKGTEYFYVDSNTPSSAKYWTLSSKDITDSKNKGALANTIAPLTAVKKPKDLVYAVYNDHDPDKQAANTYGHTKGLFMFDERTGVWLIHTATKFPKTFHGYEFPRNERFDKGQTVLCVTFPSSQLETIADHLRLQKPNIYAHASRSDWYKNPNLESLVNKEEIKEGHWFRTGKLHDVAKNEYISFATNNKFQQDVYSALVAPELKSNLLVSTWLNSPGAKREDYLGGPYTVKNVHMLNFNLSADNSIEVVNTVDHSKWAVSENPNIHYVCVGTLNRKEPQERRGGETLCFKNTVLHRLLRTSVRPLDKSSRKRPRNENTDKLTIGK